MRRAAAAAVTLPLAFLAAPPAAAAVPVIEVDGFYYDTAPCVVYFTNGTFDPADGDTISDHWDFGDGTSSTSVFPLHAYEAGTWTIVYTATDSSGEVATETLNPPIQCNAPEPTPFADISTSFARSQIESLYGKLIAAGTSATTYSPGTPVTREQMAIFLIKTWEDAFVDSYGPADPSGFTDTATSFAAEAIDQIAELGITAGCSATQYCPQNVVTREQMAVFLIRLWDDLVFDPLPAPSAADLDRFSDTANSFALTEIAQLVNLGITAGTTPTTFSPTQAVTREQMAAFLMALERSLR